MAFSHSGHCGTGHRCPLLFPRCFVLSFCSSQSARDVLVTGAGLVTPLGCSVDETWRRLLSGETAGRQLGPQDIDHFEQLTQIEGMRLNGAPVNHSQVAQRLSSSSILDNVPLSWSQAWTSEPLVAMSLVAWHEAWTQACLPLYNLGSSRRVAVVFGSSKGGLRTAELLSQIQGSTKQQSKDDSLSRAAEFTNRLWTHAFPTDSATRAIATLTQATAAVSCPVAACATGLISILQGAAMVHTGLCDLCIVGSADAGLRASVMSSFHRLRVTSRSLEASTACRPFDESRDGFLIGEGAGVLILESRQHAEARGIRALAKVSGGGWLSDPTGMTQIDASGLIVEQILRRTDTTRTLRPDVISLHGTGTESNDLAEARGLHKAFEGNSPPCFGVKGAIGHLLGAAGSVESVITLLALQHRQIPGTTNLNHKDARCHIPLTSKPLAAPQMQRAAKLSLGFGGHVACGVFDSEP